MIWGVLPTMPPIRKAATFNFCQPAMSSRRTIAILVSNRISFIAARDVPAMDLTTPDQRGLERSCRDRIVMAPHQPGLERMEAYFSGHAFDRHSHDCYALGYTMSGVQMFDYRGA